MTVKTILNRTSAVFVAAALSVTLAACGGGSGPTSANGGGDIPTGQAQYNPQPYDNLKDGGTLTTAVTEVTPQFNVWQGDATLYTRNVWNWYNPLIITFTADGDAVYNRDYLADVKQELVDGNTRITYTINPKATYNDGAPIDWHSFEAVWKANGALNPAYIVSSTDGYDRIKSVTGGGVDGRDDRQAVVTFKGVNLWWQSLYNNLLNPKALDLTVFNQGYINTPHVEWGAGPYMIDKFDKQNGTISFIRNPRWWGKKGKLDSRTYLTLESSASINAFKNGQTDAAGVGTKDRLAQVSGMTGIDIRKSVSPSLAYFTLNGQTPVLSDVRVRKAVFEAIDRKQLMEIEFQGLGFTGQLPGSMVLLSFQKGYQDVISKLITFNPDQAKQDLEAAGWTAGPDGTRTKDGRPLEFTYVNTGDDATNKAVATATAAMLKNVGIKMDIRQTPSSDFSKIINGKTFDMYYSGVSQTDPFGIAYICQLYCSDTTLIKSGVNSPALDAQLRAVNSLTTPEEQFAKSAEVETEALKTYGVLPTIESPDILAVKKGLANYGAGRFFTTTPENIGWQK